ncbi:MAG TPA: hypothetical protein VE642_14070, partial [Pyrinomonadaceae bacterium]|nr:hypothetical protein [Pyrinomonadaceae bacterium]
GDSTSCAEAARQRLKSRITRRDRFILIGGLDPLAGFSFRQNAAMLQGRGRRREAPRLSY